MAEGNDRVASMLKDFKEEFQTTEGAKTRSKAKTALPEEAQKAYKTQDYEIALTKFCKYLAAVLLDKSPDGEVEASLLANIGSCLHHLNDDELAKKYYTQALEAFESKCYTPRMTWLFYGDINQRRIDYVKARIGVLHKGHKPDITKYLDGYGKERQWSAAEMKGEEFGYLDYVNPASWYRYYTEVPSTEPAVEATQAAA